jgi:membrane protein implicated in regulation of membrane protease activity
VRSTSKAMLALAAIALWPGIALAYVGPGAGISMLGALWGLLLGIFTAIGVVLFWPIRSMLRKRKAKRAAAAGGATADSAEQMQAADEETSDATQS